MNNLIHLSKHNILSAFHRLDELAKEANKRIEISVYGGAAIILSFDGIRTSTFDVDAIIHAGRDFARQAIKKIAEENEWDDNWLNDAVKGFISESEHMENLSDWPEKETGLIINIATPEYLLAMKCMAMRQEIDKHDIDDIKGLIKICNFTKSDEVLDLVEKFYPYNRMPPKVSLGVASIFDEINNAVIKPKSITRTMAP